MPRIQFELPEQFTFSTEIQIYISHVNQGGHLDNAQLLTLVSEARVRFFQALGYLEANIEGLAVVVGDIVRSTAPKRFTAKPCACKCWQTTSTLMVLTLFFP